MRFLLMLAIMASWSVLSSPLHKQAKIFLSEGADSLLAVMENAIDQENVLGPGTSLDPVNEIDQENDLNQDNDFDSKKNFDNKKDFNYTEEETDTPFISEDDVMTALGLSETNSSTVPDEPTDFTPTASEEENDTPFISEDDVMTALGLSETDSSTVPDEPTDFTPTASEEETDTPFISEDDVMTALGLSETNSSTVPDEPTDFTPTASEQTRYSQSEGDGQEAKTVIQLFIQIISPEVSRRYRPPAQHQHGSPGSSGQQQEITGPQSHGKPYEELGPYPGYCLGLDESCRQIGFPRPFTSTHLDLFCRGIFPTRASLIYDCCGFCRKHGSFRRRVARHVPNHFHVKRGNEIHTVHLLPVQKPRRRAPYFIGR